MRSFVGLLIALVSAACKREHAQQRSNDTAMGFASQTPARPESSSHQPLIDSILEDTGFVCIPDSTFRLGAVQVGDSGETAVHALGTPLSRHEDVERGMDYHFPITVYRYKDLEVIVTHSTGRVAAIRPLTPVVRTPLGLYLGMLRSEAEQLFPRGALGPVIGGKDPPKNALEAYGCGDRTSTIELEFDSQSRLARLTLNGFYGGPN